MADSLPFGHLAVGIDLIYEGIATEPPLPFRPVKFVGIDLIYEGIATKARFPVFKKGDKVGIDLIYEGIATRIFLYGSCDKHPSLELT